MDEGIRHPANYVAAVIDTCSDTEAAVNALRSMGYLDIHWFHGVEVFVAIQAASRYENSLIRALRRVCEVGDDGEVRQYLLSALYRGGCVVVIYVPTPLQARHVCNILARRHVHDLWRLGDQIAVHVPA
jgi:hypothetical protein